MVKESVRSNAVDQFYNSPVFVTVPIAFYLFYTEKSRIRVTHVEFISHVPSATVFVK